MKSNYGWILIGILFIFEGTISLFGYKIFLKYSGWINISINGSIYLFIVGIFLCTYGFLKKEPKEKITKCPKCKEVFNCNELKDGKCKYCKDVDTIDIEEYFKQYPNELEDKEK
ncbi:hypothetical protein [Aliarcobacter butzleri]|uniref:hypothetical protein n=1 Tax=Aliarcobacter butzleri TaxID=28197 RepID=UPI00125F6221|nr:hypothetical protein [Aliarcobacter butzleri]